MCFSSTTAAAWSGLSGLDCGVVVIATIGLVGLTGILLVLDSEL